MNSSPISATVLPFVCHEKEKIPHLTNIYTRFFQSFSSREYGARDEFRILFIELYNRIE